MIQLTSLKTIEIGEIQSFWEVKMEILKIFIKCIRKLLAHHLLIKNITTSWKLFLESKKECCNYPSLFKDRKKLKSAMSNVDEFVQWVTICHFNIEVVDVFFSTLNQRSLVRWDCSHRWKLTMNLMRQFIFNDSTVNVVHQRLRLKWIYVMNFFNKKDCILFEVLDS